MTLSNAKIIRYCSWGLILAYIITFGFSAAHAKFIGGDFVCFYAASQMLAGGAPAIYDMNNILEVEKQITGYDEIHTIGWYYPPTFLLVVSQLANLPYLASLFLWMAVTLAGFVLVVRQIAPHPYIVGFILAFPGTYRNFISGQNGYLSALLLGQGLLLLERHPRIAGLILGLLVYKPQLAMLIVIALVASRKWPALIAACASAAVLTSMSILSYGTASWKAFYATLPAAAYLMETGALPWSKMATFFSLARLLGVSVPWAYGLQAVATVVAFIAVYWVWRKRIFPLAYIVLTISVFFATPYAFHYDLTIIGLTIAWYGWEAHKKGWLPYEKPVLLLAWFMPVINIYVALYTNIQIAPVVLSALLVLALRRQYVLEHPGEEIIGDITLLTPGLIRNCSWYFVFGYVITLSLWAFTGAGVPGQSENVMGGDFLSFYTSSQKLLSGDVAGVYDTIDLQEVEKQTADQQTTGRVNPNLAGEVYPPVFLLIIACLTALPYLVSLLSWLAVTLAGFVLVVRKIAPHPCTVGVALAFPGTFQNFIHGQSGFLSALLLGQGLLLLEQRPGLAGAILGLLVYKPHIAVLAMIALAAGRKWRALIAACASAAAMIMISISFYGIESWQAFYRTIPVVQYCLETGALPLGSMPTFFAVARLLGVSVPVAYGLQAIVAVAAVIAVAWVWRKRVFPLAYVVLTAGIFLVTPYTYQYDLAIAGLGIAWYAWEGLKNGWLPYEKNTLLFAWLMPAISSPIVRLTNIQIVPVVLLALLVLALRRQHVLTNAAVAVPEGSLAAVN